MVFVLVLWLGFRCLSAVLRLFCCFSSFVNSVVAVFVFVVCYAAGFVGLCYMFAVGSLWFCCLGVFGWLLVGWVCDCC